MKGLVALLFKQGFTHIFREGKDFEQPKSEEIQGRKS
jgi:hypothetical protein